MQQMMDKKQKNEQAPHATDIIIIFVESTSLEAASSFGEQLY